MSFTEMLTDKKRVKWVFILTLISCFVTLFVSYSSWIIKGCRVFMPFISDMDLYQPEDTIFSAGGTLAGLFVLITLSDICWIKRSEIKRHSLSNFVNFMNYVALIPGALAAVSVMLLVNTPWNVNEPLHITLANNIFYGGAAWGILISIVSWRLNKANPNKSNILYWRAFSALFAGFSLVMMIRTFGNIDWSFYSEVDRMEYANSGKLCHSEYLAGAPVAAAYEWLLILGILGVIITFWNDLNFNSSQEEE